MSPLPDPPTLFDHLRRWARWALSLARPERKPRVLHVTRIMDGMYLVEGAETYAEAMECIRAMKSETEA